jgi:membrane protein
LFGFLKNLVWNTGKKFYADHCPQLAAAITYYLIFSIFPFLIFIVGVAGMLLSESLQEEIIDEIVDTIPVTQDEGRNEIEDALNSISGASAQAVSIIGLAGLVWTSSSMFNSMRRALNVIYREPAYTRPWVQQKAIDLALVLALGVFFVGSVVVTGMMSVIEARSEEFAWPGDLSARMGTLWNILEWLLPAAFSFFGFLALYTVVPSRRRGLVNAIPGALVASVLFQAVTSLFGLYLVHFTDFAIIYGSLGAVFGFMFWIYVSAQIMLLGAVIADVYSRSQRSYAAQPGLPGMGVPLYRKAWRTIKSLFVRPAAPDERD